MNLEDKYKKIKKKFYKYFIADVEPEKRGSNIPASSIRFYDDKYNYINFGDSTFYLSEYIQFLTIEYLVQIKEKKRYNQTLYRLYKALKTFERLDKTANSYYDYFGGVYEENLDGFFVRGDIDYDILELNPNIKDFDKTKGIKVSSELVLFSNIKNHIIDGNVFNKEMSQDQVWALLPAFAIVAKSFPDEEIPVKSKEGDFMFNFKKFSQETIHRVISYMGKECKWKIKNGLLKNRNVMRGHNVSFNSYAFAKCGDIICEGSGLPKLTKLVPWYGKISYKVVFALSRILYYGILPNWKWLDKKISIKDYSFSCFSCVGEIGINSKKFLENNVSKRDNYTHLYLLNNVLNGGKLKISKEFFVNFLEESHVQNFYFKNIWWDWANENPVNWKYGDQPYSNYRWSTKNNCAWSNIRFDNAEPINIYSSGLDYMLIYNLYKLCYEL
jgi:hypothetical protein